MPMTLTGPKGPPKAKSMFLPRGATAKKEDPALRSKLIERLDALTDDRGYDEMPRGAVLERLSDGAALFSIPGEAEGVWFPYGQMRELDGDVYVSHWIMKQKGLD